MIELSDYGFKFEKHGPVYRAKCTPLELTKAWHDRGHTLVEFWRPKTDYYPSPMLCNMIRAVPPRTQREADYYKALVSRVYECEQDLIRAKREGSEVNISAAQTRLETAKEAIRKAK